MELNKSLLDCMRAVRRRLREEQALDIHFQQRDAIAAMQAACARSGDATTRELGQRLGRLSGVALPPAEPSLLPAQAPRPTIRRPVARLIRVPGRATRRRTRQARSTG